MTTLIDFILNLFRNESAAEAFVVDPEQALLDAGLSNVTSAQIQSVAATAVPSLALGGGDPVVGLQRAVENHYGFEPQAAWAPTWAPQNDLLSNNDTRLLSPETNIFHDRSFDLGFGDIMFGSNKTSADDGAVVVGDDNEGDIASGDGAVVGDENSVNNGEIDNGDGSIVNVGDDNETNQGNTAVGDDLLTNDDGTVIQTSDGTTTASQGDLDWTVVDGDQTVTSVDGIGNYNGVDNTETEVNTETNASWQSTAVVDNSVQDSSEYSPEYDTSYDASSEYNASYESSSTYAPSYDGSVDDNTTVQTQETGIGANFGF